MHLFCIEGDFIYDLYFGLVNVIVDRVAGATSEVNALKEALNNGKISISPISPLLIVVLFPYLIGQNFIDQYTDINAVCGVVKFWFRTLPETVIPELFFESIVEAARRCSEFGKRLFITDRLFLF